MGEREGMNFVVQGRVNRSAKSNSSKRFYLYAPIEKGLPELMSAKVTCITFRVSLVAESELEYFAVFS